MSGFSPAWLALREAADRRSRAAALRDDLAAAFAPRDRLSVVDLGCGTGANLRATACLLPLRQDWLMVDHDARLLAAAREALIAWADEARPEGAAIVLRKDERRITVMFRQADLAAGIDPILPERTDLVTASALLDLVSAAWLEALARAVARRRALLYAVLSYDGAEAWEPADPADPAMLAAFVAHQRRDKGFGPAAGPAAVALAEAALARLGYEVRTAPSPWRLDRADAALVTALAEGIAAAVTETGLVPPPEVARWLAARRAAAGCVNGHRDLLARPAVA